MIASLFVQPYVLFWQGAFIKLLALTYFLAFFSLYVQLPALYGSNGIQPAHVLLDWVRKRAKNYYLICPTLFWVSSSDRSLKIGALIGMAAALLVIVGAPAAPLLVVLWAIYLSFKTIGSEFLSFQWDILLLEMGFIAIFFAIQWPPPPLFVYLLWFLLFHFMLSSGLMKFVWGSSEWRDLTAMRYHYETQPIPNRLAYYMHQLPDFLGKLTVVAVFVWEIILPFFIFSPSWVRIGVFALLVLLQLLIVLTGNFAFFNILTVVLCIPLLMDVNPGVFYESFASQPAVQTNMYLNGFLSLIAAVLLIMNMAELALNGIRYQPFAKVLSRITMSKYLAPYAIVNWYGLFSHMTTKRYEIVIEGSLDDVVWSAYEFRWKPGDLARAPPQVAPHQPRLDWQMWFAALRGYQQQSWLTNVMIRLLEGSPEVTALFQTNPFANAPPKFIRCKLYLYHFSDLKIKKSTGYWWTRQFVGMFSPTFSLNKS